MKSKIIVKVQKRDYETVEVKTVINLLKDSDRVSNFRIIRDMQWHPTVSFEIDSEDEFLKDMLATLAYNEAVEVYIKE